jgi:hypothetical protein
MNSTNILINKNKVLPIFKRITKKPKNWQGLFNFKNIENNLLLNSSFVMNGCSIEYLNNEYICKPFSYKINKEIINLFKDLDLDIFYGMLSFKKTSFKSLSLLIFYVYLELIVDYINKDEAEFIKIFKNNLLTEGVNGFYRSSVLEINKQSIYLEKKGKKIVVNQSIDEKLISLFDELKISSLELPSDYEYKKTIDALIYFKQIMDKVNFPIKARKFNLKLKKLGIYKDDGFYSKELNTIIVDARNVNVFIHELGHLIFDNNIKINKKIRSFIKCI